VSDLADLRPEQRELLDGWLGPYRVLADHSWPQQTTRVLELDSPRAGHVIAKASTAAMSDHHLVRETLAFQEFGPRLGAGFSTLLHADAAAHLLVLRHLPGRLAEGSDWELAPEVHRAAGELLGHLHRAAPPQPSAEYQVTIRDKCLLLLDRGRELLSATTWSTAREHLARFRPGTVELVPTHGDFQPRNWLVDPDDRDSSGTPRTRLIDLGRAERRPWYSDLVRLHHQSFVDHPELRLAVFAGLGRAEDPPDDELGGWHLEHLLQSVGTVVWATDIGDRDFARRGEQMLERTLREWSG